MSVMAYLDGHFTETPVEIKVQNRELALIEPCLTTRVAIASEAKLSLLPGYGNIKVLAGE